MICTGSLITFLMKLCTESSEMCENIFQEKVRKQDVPVGKL